MGRGGGGGCASSEIRAAGTGSSLTPKPQKPKPSWFRVLGAAEVWPHSLQTCVLFFWAVHVRSLCKPETLKAKANSKPQTVNRLHCPLV